MTVLRVTVIAAFAAGSLRLFPACSSADDSAGSGQDGAGDFNSGGGAEPNAAASSGGAGLGGGTGSDRGEAAAPSFGAPLTIGASCRTDADCDEGLACFLDSTVFGGGIPGGMCTRSCRADGDCWDQDPNAICVGAEGEAVCVATCSSAGSAGKCGSRLDMACFPLEPAGDAGARESICQPLCSTDAQCAGGLVCDARLGLCVDPADRHGGLPLGAECDPAAPTDPCEGFCVESAGSGVCSQSCTIGVAGGCGGARDPTRLNAACTLTLDDSMSSEPGDLGLCGQLCDCNTDCRHPAWHCAPWDPSVSADNRDATGRAGSCVPPAATPGQMDGSAGADAAGASSSPTGIERCPGLGDGGSPDGGPHDGGGIDARMLSPEAGADGSLWSDARADAG